MFSRILIANRGEIAVRVIRACRDLEVTPIAVYSTVDRAARHVRLADEAYEIGEAPAADSYLRIDRIVDAALHARADAVHPGYGFLAENAEFARAVAQAGLVFIGPPPEVMELMGSKTNARRAVTAAGAMVVPGTIEPLASYEQAERLARDFGYPVMLKAAAGGGGKGMRLVTDEAGLQSAYETARSEALAAFGSEEVYLEKAIERPRHIEIQIFADAYGHTVHLGERECSIQRRHQKVIEECPSPLRDADLRERMGAAAIKIARSAGYVGAGTIEFLFSDLTRDFYFLEMNTRLQVEHPVTEMVTGIDLVREQITVAAGAPLSFAQTDVKINGHAIECRVYAEDPDNNFLPSPGRITRLRTPDGPGIRDDSGVDENAEVSIYYDPLISKLIAWGRTRDEAIDRLRRALDDYRVGGIKTTLGFFRNVVRDREFIEGRLDTNFITRFFERTPAPVAAADDKAVQRQRDIAMIAVALDYEKQLTAAQPQSVQTSSSEWRRAGRAELHRSRM